MATAKINVCVEEDVKRQSEALFNQMGLNMTTAINIYLKRVIAEGGIPFEVTARGYNAETLRALGEYDEMKTNPESYKRYATFKDALNDVL